MQSVSRRTFVKATLGSALLSLAAVKTDASESKANIVILGGGFGGASCAMMLKKLSPALQVTLIDANRYFYTCPFSNFVIGGMRSMDQIRFGYDKLGSLGVDFIMAKAETIRAKNRTIQLDSGQTVNYDKLVVSPGIDFVFDALEGYSQDDTERIPHAYKASEQTLILKKQLESMEDGGVFGIIPPPNPYRCPPGPYERASVVAAYFTRYKPKSKILIFDPKEKFSKQALFSEGWNNLYPEMIDWYSGTAGGALSEIDVKGKTVFTEFGEEKLDVINYIPPQRAGAVAHRSGLTDESGWCPVNADFSSQKAADIYVIGDASKAGAMPKSGFSANNQGKFVAYNIVNELRGLDPVSVKLNNVCYSFVGPNYSISVAAVYEVKSNTMVSVPDSGGTSALNASADVHAKEAHYAESWYRSITREMFG